MYSRVGYLVGKNFRRNAVAQLERATKHLAPLSQALQKFNVRMQKF